MGQSCFNANGFLCSNAGSKNGLEKKIRDKAPKMVDIDGDICHHIHNESNKFCQIIK